MSKASENYTNRYAQLPVMTQEEFIKQVKQSKKSKTIRFTIIASLIGLIGIVMVLFSIFDRVHTKAPISAFIAGLLFILMGLGIIYSIKDTWKFSFVNNKNTQEQNQELLEELPTIFEMEKTKLKSNHFQFEPKRKWLQSSVKVEALALENKIILNIDSPGTKKSGIITFGAGRKIRKLILGKLKSA